MCGRFDGVHQLNARRFGGCRRKIHHASRNVSGNRVFSRDGKLDGFQHVCGSCKSHAALGMRAFCLLAGPDMTQALDGVQGVLKGHAIGKFADAFLKELYGCFRVDTVLTIWFAAGKSQDVQAFLKLTHVIAVKVWQPQIQRAISKLIAFIDKQHPCGGVNVFTKRKIMVKTEPSNGFGGGRTRVQSRR